LSNEELPKAKTGKKQILESMKRKKRRTKASMGRSEGKGGCRYLGSSQGKTDISSHTNGRGGGDAGTRGHQRLPAQGKRPV